MYALLASLVVGAVASLLAAELEARATKLFCSTVVSLVSAVKQQGPATTYCSAYLGIFTVTTST
jgi:hypothetical protein